MPLSQSTHVLASRARSGDVDAFAELAREYSTMVYRVAFQVVGNSQDAQDVSQRALLSAWQGLNSFRGDSAFSTWLHQIVRRHALTSAARSARYAWVGYEANLADSRGGPAETFLGRDAAASVHAAVAALPARQRSVVRLYHFSDLSYAQIAAATHSSESAVRSQLFRARRSLAAALADQR